MPLRTRNNQGSPTPLTMHKRVAMATSPLPKSCNKHSLAGTGAKENRFHSRRWQEQWPWCIQPVGKEQGGEPGICRPCRSSRNARCTMAEEEGEEEKEKEEGDSDGGEDRGEGENDEQDGDERGGK
ncbi:hypothetical protein DFP72DRAFT_850716 [Ephemerocybe angulata]|uniref:Uncharacterized protein n=1 Tax=Ephemerocybe angulata TaxID=980116 RepID=A0A8H6HRT4_9AGAR|nr:hypothetical protein DFP72DRAFT_850716 [Tulosesus angulatus]